MDDYYSVDTIGSFEAGLARDHPGLVRRFALPNATAGGRTCHGLHLSTAHDAGRDALAIIGGVHGCEWGSSEIALNVVQMLAQAADRRGGLKFGRKTFPAAALAALLAQRDLFVVPCVNPDGRHRSRTEFGRALWRKNCNPAHSGGDPERVGVDINRNFDFLFEPEAYAPDAGLSASGDPGNPFYRGPSAFSEPESRNVRWLLDQHPTMPIRWFVDLHCSGPSISYVWNVDEAQQADPAMSFRNPQHDGQRGRSGDPQVYGEFLAGADAIEMHRLAGRFAGDLQAVRGQLYPHGPAFQVAPFSGTSHDYAYARHLVDSTRPKVYAFCVEWGERTHPAVPEMRRIIADVSAGLIGLALATLEPPDGPA